MRIKKFLRIVTAGLVAALMPFTIIAVAGCSSKDDDPTPEPEPKPKHTVTIPDINLSTGNEIYDAIISSDFAALTYYTEYSVGGLDGSDSSVSAKLNADGSYADVEVYSAEKGYGYFFMRDSALYATADTFNEKVTDFTQTELDGVLDFSELTDVYLGALGESGIELNGDTDGLFSLKELIKSGLALSNYEILSRGDAANAVTVIEQVGQVYVDLNLAVYNSVNQIKALLNGLTGDMTIAEILDDEIVKTSAQIVTELISPEALKTMISEFNAVVGDMSASTPEEYQQVAAMKAVMQLVNGVFQAVEPDEDSSTYDYIVKVLSSQELVNVINSLLQEATGTHGIGITQKVTDFTVEDILYFASLVAEQPVWLEDLKETANLYIDLYTSGITQTSCSISVEGEELFSFSYAGVLYRYDEEGLTSMQSGMTLSVTTEEYGKIEIIEEETVNFSRTAYAADDFAAIPENLPEIDGFDTSGTPDYYDQNAMF